MKTRKVQKGGDLGQIIGATAVGGILLWVASQFSRKKYSTSKMNSSKLVREFNEAERVKSSAKRSDKVSPKSIKFQKTNRRKKQTRTRHPTIKNKKKENEGTIKVYPNKPNSSTASNYNSAKNNSSTNSKYTSPMESNKNTPNSSFSSANPRPKKKAIVRRRRRRLL